MVSSIRAVIYSRVSTDEQSTANQIPVLEAWAQARGLELVRTYQEQESAWKGGHQKELARLIDDAARRRFDYVLVWALDRLSREGALATLQLVDRLARVNVTIASYQEPWAEAPGPLREILLSIAGWVAKMESQRRSERTKAGLARARSEGRKLGRPRKVTA